MQIELDYHDQLSKCEVFEIEINYIVAFLITDQSKKQNKYDYIQIRVEPSIRLVQLVFE